MMVPIVTSDACPHQHRGPCSRCLLWENVAPRGSPPHPGGRPGLDTPVPDRKQLGSQRPVVKCVPLLRALQLLVTPPVLPWAF